MQLWGDEEAHGNKIFTWNVRGPRMNGMALYEMLKNGWNKDSNSVFFLLFLYLH